MKYSSHSPKCYFESESSILNKLINYFSLERTETKSADSSCDLFITFH